MECQPIAIRFGEFLVDPADRRLHGPHGEIHVGGRAFDVLETLLAAEGRLVTKDELFKTVWNGLTVSDAALTSVIRDLRQALDDRDRDGMIKAVYGKGYRLEAGEISRSEATPASFPVSSAEKRPKLRAALAVLPFANLTGHAGNDYLCDGMAEELLDMLGACSGFRIAARASSFSPKVREMASTEAAKALGVDAILEGSVRAAGKRLRIGARLINGTDGYVLWSQSFDRDMNDIFVVQTEVAGAVVDALADRLNPSIVALPPLPKRSSRHVEAYKLLLQSQWLCGQGTPAFLSKAVVLCEQAIELSPDFDECYARLANLLVVSAQQSDLPDPKSLRRAEQLADKALSLGPHSICAQNAKAMCAGIAGRLLEADSYLRNAILQRPNIAWHYLAHATFVSGAAGHLQAAIPDMSIVDSAIAFDPAAAGLMAIAYATAGANDSAERYIELAHDFGLPHSSMFYSEVRALLHARDGRLEEAADVIIASLEPLAEAKISQAVRLAYLALGDVRLKPAAVEAIAAVHKDGIKFLTTMTRKRLVLFYAQLGEADRAVNLLAETVRDLNARGMVGAGWGYLWLEELREVQRHPDFIPIARSLGFVEYWEVHGPPDGYHFDGENLVPVN